MQYSCSSYLNILPLKFKLFMNHMQCLLCNMTRWPSFYIDQINLITLGQQLPGSMYITVCWRQPMIIQTENCHMRSMRMVCRCLQVLGWLLAWRLGGDDGLFFSVFFHTLLVSGCGQAGGYLVALRNLSKPLCSPLTVPGRSRAQDGNDVLH